jgi:hypothetical protein
MGRSVAVVTKRDSSRKRRGGVIAYRRAGRHPDGARDGRGGSDAAEFA